MEQPSTKHVPAQRVIALPHKGTYDAMGLVYHRLREWAREHKVRTEGLGFTVFLSPPNEQNWKDAEYEVCVPIAGEVKAEGPIVLKDVPESDVASVTVAGPYGDIPAHYAEMLAWLDVNGMEIAGSPREVYLRRPDAQGRGDPQSFLTEIQIPIRP